MSDIITLLFENTQFQIMVWMLVFLVVLVVAMYTLELKNKRTEKKDYEKIFESARNLGCSEYDIFQLSARFWNIPKGRAEIDFTGYLFSSEIPYYVRDFLRNRRKQVKDDKDSLLEYIKMIESEMPNK